MESGVVVCDTPIDKVKVVVVIAVFKLIVIVVVVVIVVVLYFFILIVGGRGILLGLASIDGETLIEAGRAACCLYDVRQEPLLILIFFLELKPERAVVSIVKARDSDSVHQISDICLLE